MEIFIKIIKIILKLGLSLFVLMIICLALAWVLFFSVNGKEQSNNEKRLQAQVQEKGKVLILYQESRMGLTKKAVNLAAETFQAEGYSVVMNHPRGDSSYKLDDYDIIVLSSPVYVGEVSKPLVTFAGTKDFTGKKVMILLTGGDLSSTAEIEKVEKQIANAKYIKAIKVNKADDSVKNAIKEMISK